MPGQRDPGQVAAQPHLIAEILAQVQFGRVDSQFSQGGRLTLDAHAAHVLRSVVQRVGDHDRAAAVTAQQGREVLRMIAHPE